MHLLVPYFVPFFGFRYVAVYVMPACLLHVHLPASLIAVSLHLINKSEHVYPAPV